jgi:hypothetical protein
MPRRDRARVHNLMTENIELNQPLLQPGTTRRTWHDAAQRLVTLLSDISGEVVSWAGHEGIMFIELRLSATLGGDPWTSERSTNCGSRRPARSFAGTPSSTRVR